MDWIANSFLSFLNFLKTDPGSGLLVLAVLMTAGRRVRMHYDKKTQYTFAQMKKYPWEMFEMGFIALVAIFGLLKLTGVIK